jgi:hypothetical protein
MLVAPVNHLSPCGACSSLVIPPKSRRRGERGGYAYVLMTAPAVKKLKFEQRQRTEQAESNSEQSSELRKSGLLLKKRPHSKNYQQQQLYRPN